MLGRRASRGAAGQAITGPGPAQLCAEIHGDAISRLVLAQSSAVSLCEPLWLCVSPLCVRVRCGCPNLEVRDCSSLHFSRPQYVWAVPVRFSLYCLSVSV